MESSEIETSSDIECRVKSSLYSVPNMPITEQQESSFIVCGSRSSSLLDNTAAPLYSFDEDGDILPRVNNTFTPNNSVESDLDNTSLAYPDNEGRDLMSGGVANHKEKAKDKYRVIERGSASILSTASQEEEEEARVPTSTSSSPSLSTTSSRRRKLGMMKSSSGGGVSEGSTESGDTLAPPGPFAPQASSEVDKSNASSSKPEGVAPPPVPPPQVNIVLENTSVPKIDFQAPSIEVVDDYLESNLEGDSDSQQLKDLCSSLLGETGFPGHQIRSSTGSCVSLLSATPQDPGPKRQKVPFDAVVFTERKPSTGDALIQSLGLSADGTNTIQDIAFKNQGAARERMQLAEGGQVEVAAQSHCESCGVSPEDCLKKLGLHSDRESVISPSPKSEKLWQLFQQIQAGMIRFPRIRKASGSEPELDQEPETHHPKVAPVKSKSLDTSPLHSPFDDIRKPMMNTV